MNHQTNDSRGEGAARSPYCANSLCISRCTGHNNNVLPSADVRTRQMLYARPECASLINENFLALSKRNKQVMVP
jgi:hypothetical protein